MLILILNRPCEVEHKIWARFSAEQLASQYAPEDNIYDQD
jgi:hypothetical protein